MQFQVEIQIISGSDAGAWLPAGAVPPGLTFRTAVVQHTYVPGVVDMYFDEALWLALCDYVAAFDDQAVMSIIEDWRPETKGLLGKRTNIEIEPKAFMERWCALPTEERDPPGAILLRRDGQIVLWVVTEYWNRIGGPDAHHDSYTYSLFSDRDLAGELRRFLMARPEATLWRMEALTA